jgi:hypothetical protein
MFTQKFYSVYVPKGSVKPLEEAVLVQEGFNIWAFIFTAFWELYKKAWLEAFAIFLLFVLAAAVTFKFGLAMWVFRLGIQLVTGFEASEIHKSALKRRGYLLYSIICARNEGEALKKYVEAEV